MRYFVTSNDTERQAEWEERLRAHGYDIVDEYDSDVIVITLGGDGSILYASRTFADPTILPVRTGDSKGHRTVVESDELLSALAEIEETADGETYPTLEYGKLAAYQDGDQLQGGFDALNEINLHHASPVLAAIFDIRIHDRGETYEFEGVIGDGVVIATAFGSTAYYRAITGGTFTDGLGVAFNNVHTPVTTPAYLVVSTDAVIELEVVKSKRSSSGVLTRDNANEMYELSVGESITIRQSDASIELVQPELSVS